jgi:hypothetical protein
MYCGAAQDLLWAYLSPRLTGPGSRVKAVSIRCSRNRLSSAGPTGFVRLRTQSAKTSALRTRQNAIGRGLALPASLIFDSHVPTSSALAFQESRAMGSLTSSFVRRSCQSPIMAAKFADFGARCAFSSGKSFATRAQASRSHSLDALYDQLGHCGAHPLESQETMISLVPVMTVAARRPAFGLGTSARSGSIRPGR